MWESLTEEQEILSRCTKYYPELLIIGDNAVPDSTQHPETFYNGSFDCSSCTEKREVAGGDNRHVPAERVQVGEENMIHALTKVCIKIWRTGD